METKDWATLQEELLKAQIEVIRNYLRNVDSGGSEKLPALNKSRSHLSIIRDVLIAAKSSLHVSEIIQQAHEQYGVTLDRESVVSALTKKIKKGVTFIRTGPNTFGLKET
ncbi:MAG: HTH domain-containing protein [Pedobacter sp.]